MAISHAAKELGKWCDAVTGIEGSSGYLILLLLTALGYLIINGTQLNGSHPHNKNEEDGETPDPPRNFTAKQLRNFDGTVDEKTDETKPVYLSLHGKVFDVSKGKDFYGPGGPYELFAGRECGAALAQMSFEESLLDDVDACDSLGVGDKNELRNWMEKFEYYRGYPIKGRLVPESKMPTCDRIISKEELARNDGIQNAGDIQEGYVAPSIYLALGEKVFDVSFGGITMYGKINGEAGPYHRFAGKDASRALAKMSFDPADVENTSLDDLEEKQMKVLKDWIVTFEEKKGYPVVGKLDKS